VVFIDNSGFNLRIAKWAKAQNYTTHYYISPQVWASRAGRVKDIKRDIDKMFVILPFEEAFYKQ
jgi:Lipid A disaccharide synthetase